MFPQGIKLPGLYDMPKVKITGDFNAESAFYCAEVFENVARQFIDSIRKMPEGRSKNPPEEIGNLVAAATNLGVSLEIYLKTLTSLSGLSIPKTHHLHELFALLPSDIKNQLEELYQKGRSTIPRNTRSSITLAKGPINPPKWESYVKKPAALVDLLGISSDIFITWRYAFVYDAEPLTHEVHVFEYELLLLACQTIKTIIIEIVSINLSDG